MTNQISRKTEIRELSPDQIERNQDNPRLFFRTEEMETLLRSIRRYGIQVPITVYKDGKRFVLIDGERRWRCAIKLNLKTIPALVQQKPSPLENLLLMFNIHALREQWDYFTIANKLPNVIELYERQNKQRPNEVELSEITGLTRGQIRRCKFLLDMPERYRSMLAEELQLPKQKQQLSEDLFIEMERSLRTVELRIPDIVVSKDRARDVLIKKFRDGTIGNITDFRMLSKIATSVRNLGVKESRAKRAIAGIFEAGNNIGIEQVYAEQFELKYDQKKIIRNIESIVEFLEEIADSTGPLSDDLTSELEKLDKILQQVLER